MLIRASRAFALPRLGIATLALGWVTNPGLAQETPGWDYDSSRRGLEWSNPETGSYLWLGMRAQFRYSTLPVTPRDPSDYLGEQGDELDLNRLRYKVGARYHEVLSFYHEYDLRNDRFLTMRATYMPLPAVQLRAGQWKAPFNRARVDSSGKQQFAERSIATYWFTVDRQQGAVLSGRIGEGRAWDSSYWAGALVGNGRGEGQDSSPLMWLARWQWNFTRTLLPFGQSALERYEESRGSLAFAFVSNESGYTRFSSAGGGQLPGYADGDADRYRVEQFLQEFAWHRGGLSTQQELHLKLITDRVEAREDQLLGGYAQVGWFPNERWGSIPRELEFAVRAALVDPERDSDGTDGAGINGEFTLGSNWFFNKHRNKLTADVSFLTYRDSTERESDIRFQLQWDVSF